MEQLRKQKRCLMKSRLQNKIRIFGNHFSLTLFRACPVTLKMQKPKTPVPQQVFQIEMSTLLKNVSIIHLNNRQYVLFSKIQYFSLKCTPKNAKNAVSRGIFWAQKQIFQKWDILSIIEVDNANIFQKCRNFYLKHLLWARHVLFLHFLGHGEAP